MTQDDLLNLGVTEEQAGKILALLQTPRPDTFMDTHAQQLPPHFAGPVGTAAPRLTGAQFSAMGYRERVRLFEQDPKQYQMLKEQ